MSKRGGEVSRPALVFKQIKKPIELSMCATRSSSRENTALVSIEKKKRVQMHLEHARKHAFTACRFADSRMAAREIKDAVAELTQAIELLTDSLNARQELY